jgi:hypothetical protein
VSHPLRSPGRSGAEGRAGAPEVAPGRRADALLADAPAWPSYRGSAELVGTSTLGVSVYVDPSLGAPALENARDLLAGADRVVEQNDAIFATSGGPVDVIVFALAGQTDGTGGADHGGCSFQTGSAIEVDASYGNSQRVIALFEAELSECAMGGNLCGYSNGEALSRWCAMVIADDALKDFATAPQWAADGMPDWVDQTEHSDQDPDSIGCGMAFLSWLMSQGYSLAQLAQGIVALGDGGTLAALYARLSGDQASSAWPRFLAAIQALPAGVTSDDPFGALAGASAGG